MNRELKAVCGDCRHSWVIAYLPMEVSKLARIARGGACPKCASPRVFLKATDRASSELKLPHGGSSEMPPHGVSPSRLHLGAGFVPAPPPPKK